MEFIALLIALAALYLIWNFWYRLKEQEKQLLSLFRQVHDLKQVVAGLLEGKAQPQSGKLKTKSKKKAKEKSKKKQSEPLAAPAKVAALKNTRDEISEAVPEALPEVGPIPKKGSPFSRLEQDSFPQPEKPAASEESKSAKEVGPSSKSTEPSQPSVSASKALGNDLPPAKPPQSSPEGVSGGALEALVGGQWAVWVGGIALALGGIFLVRYSIEAGMLGPKVRLILASLFGMSLLAAGEFIRRRSIDIAIAKIDSAYVPGILTAAGSMVLFAAIYAAYGVFHFIGPAMAFALLGAVSIATLALALLHGPSLAALGLVGSYVTPVLVSTSRPNYLALFLFLFIVTATALALARWRQWVWLVSASAIGALGWAAASVGLGDARLLHSFSLGGYIIALGIMYCAHAVNWTDTSSTTDDATDDSSDGLFISVLLTIAAALGLIVSYYADRTSYAFDAIIVAIIVVLSMGGTAWIRNQFSTLFAIAAASALLIFTGWSLKDVFIDISGAFSRSFSVSVSANEGLAMAKILIGSLLAALAIVAGTIGLLRHVNTQKFTKEAVWWALPVAVVPLVIALVTWLSLGMGYSKGLFVAGIVGVMLLAAATEMILRRAPSLTSQSLFEVLPLSMVAGSAALLAIATLEFYFNNAVLVVLLALLALAIAGTCVIRPITALRYGAAAAAALAIARVVMDPVLGLDPQPTIIFNSILPAYGLPVLALGGAGWLLAKWGKDAPQRFLEGAAVLFAALLFTLEIRHGMNGGDILAKEYTLGEQAGHTITALVMSGAMMRLDDRSPSIVFRGIMQLLGYVSLAMVVFMHGYSLNPLITNEPVGTGYLFNLLLIAYLLPGLIAGVVHWLARTRRDATYVTVLEATTWLLIASWVFMTICHFYVGEKIGLRSHHFTMAEAFTHSLVLLSVIALVNYSSRWLFANWQSRLLPIIGYGSLGMAIIVNLVLFNPLINNDATGSGAVINLLLVGYLLPGLVAAALHWHARMRPDEIYTLATEVLTWLLLSLWAFVTIRHVFVGEHIGVFHNAVKIAEGYSHTLTALVIILLVSLAYRQLYANWKSPVLLAVLGLVMAGFIAVNFLIFMPWQSGLKVGDGWLFNLLLPGFLLPSLAWLVIRHLWNSIKYLRFPNLSRALGGLALLSAFAWATFMVRHAWHGTELDGGHLSSLETYAYSAVWLAMGAGILVLSGWRGTQDLRIASAAVIFVTVLKVFLYDMSALEGVLRALSFIGLGIVLIAIGLFYQRLLFRDKAANPPQEMTPDEQPVSN